jgi:hypothetical protein
MDVRFGPIDPFAESPNGERAFAYCRRPIHGSESRFSVSHQNKQANAVALCISAQLVKIALKIAIPYTPICSNGDIAIVGVSRILDTMGAR